MWPGSIVVSNAIIIQQALPVSWPDEGNNGKWNILDGEIVNKKVFWDNTETLNLSL